MYCMLSKVALNHFVLNSTQFTFCILLPDVTVLICFHLLMVFQDIEFLPSRASFFATFLKNCGRGGSLSTTTCIQIVVGGKQGHTYTFAPQSLFLCQSNLMEIIRLLQRLC